MCNNNNDCSCFSRIIERIITLQQQGDNCNDFGCDRPFLGNTASSLGLNTRPITFYGCTGEQFTFPYTINGETGTSGVFRVENLDECCCRCRVLAPNSDTTSTYPYVATDDFFTINLKCICAIKCLGDTYVSGV